MIQKGGPLELSSCLFYLFGLSRVATDGPYF